MKNDDFEGSDHLDFSKSEHCYYLFIFQFEILAKDWGRLSRQQRFAIQCEMGQWDNSFKFGKRVVGFEF